MKAFIIILLFPFALQANDIEKKTHELFFNGLNSKIESNPKYVVEVCKKRILLEKQKLDNVSLPFVSQLINYCWEKVLKKEPDQELIASMTSPFSLPEDCFSKTCIEFVESLFEINYRLGDEKTLNAFVGSIRNKASKIQKKNYKTMIEGRYIYKGFKLYGWLSKLLTYSGLFESSENLSEDIKLVSRLSKSFSYYGLFEASEFIYLTLSEVIGRVGAPQLVFANQSGLSRTYALNAEMEKAEKTLYQLIEKSESYKEAQDYQKFISLMEYATVLRESGKAEKARSILQSAEGLLNNMKSTDFKGWLYMEKSHHLFDQKKYTEAYENLDLAHKIYSEVRPEDNFFVDLKLSFFKLRQGADGESERAQSSAEKYLVNLNETPFLEYYFLYEKALWSFQTENKKALDSVLERAKELLKYSDSKEKFLSLIESLQLALEYKINKIDSSKRSVIAMINKKDSLFGPYYRSMVVSEMIKKQVLPNLSKDLDTKN